MNFLRQNGAIPVPQNPGQWRIFMIALALNQMQQYILRFTITAVVISVLFSILGSIDWFEFFDSTFFFRLELALWPSLIIMMATVNYTVYSSEYFLVLGIAIIINSILYGIVGALTWYGMFRRRWVLYILAAAIVTGWYRMLTLWAVIPIVHYRTSTDPAFTFRGFRK